MSIRDTVNRSPWITAAFAAGIVICVTVLVAREIFGSNRPAGADLRFYSDDDGATYFAAKAANPPGFMHNGKPAYVALVYQCGGKPFVGLLQQYSPAVQAKLAAIDFAPGSQARSIERSAGATQVEVKRPGDQTWVAASDPAYARTARIRCPDGTAGDLEPLYP